VQQNVARLGRLVVLQNVARLGRLVVLQNSGSRRRCEVVGNWLISYPVASFDTDLAETPFILEHNSSNEIFQNNSGIHTF
jgi:hypothetical protein